MQQSDNTPVKPDEFYGFSRNSLPILHDGQQMEDTWHLQAISKRLDDVLEGNTKRLIINAPPRSLKYFLASVALPAFALGQRQSRKIICATYSQVLTNKLSSDTRNLVESTYFRKLFTNTSLDAKTQNEIQTAQGGYNRWTSVGGPLTGRGADIFVVDDPLNASDGTSDARRRQANGWFSRVLVPRLDSRKNGAIIVIMHRLHRNDLSGYLLEKDGFELLHLPAVAPKHLSMPIWNDIYPWKAGDPLQPNRKPTAVLQQNKADVAAEVFAAQYLQAPVLAEDQQ